MTHRRPTILLALALLTLPGATVAAQLPQTAAPQTAPETRPPGDIPDSQAFVRFTVPGRYSLEVPEGWARLTAGSRVSFVSPLGRVEVAEHPAMRAPTAASVRVGVLGRLSQTDPSVHVTRLQAVTLPAGPAILARFSSAGAVNEVTGRRAPLDNDLYVLRHGPREVVLRLSGPQGADNVDTWTRIARSLAWR